MSKLLLVIAISLMLIISCVSGCPIEDDGHYITFVIYERTQDFFDPWNLVTNQTVIVSEVESTTSQGLFEYLGLATNNPVKSKPIAVIQTDKKGSFTLPMHEEKKYQIGIQNKSFYVYPRDSMYRIWVN